jgi:predicted RNase H-like HicB family nuclease
MLNYHAAYYPIEDGWFMVRVLDFPGVISQGRSIEHARKMIQDALCLMAEHRLEQGQALPRPNPRARDKKAVQIEAIRLKIGARLADAS